MEKNMPLGTSKEEFIRGIQEVLGKKERRPVEPYQRLRESLADLEERLRVMWEKLEGMRSQLLGVLVETAAKMGWNVYCASSTEEALGHIRGLMESKGVKRVVRSDQEIFAALPIDQYLADMDILVTVMARNLAGMPEGLREEAASADIGITGVDYAIAETGSVVVMPRQGLSRLVSLLPSIHLAILQPHQVLESMEDIFLLRRQAYLQDGDMGSYMNFITGPSRTADIEQTIVIGVHGPKEAHMLILE